MLKRPPLLVLLLAFATIIMLADAAGGWGNLFGIALTVGAAALVFRVMLARSTTKEPQTSARERPRPPTELKTRNWRTELQLSSSHRSHAKIAQPALEPRELIDLVPPEMLGRSGSVFYSGRRAFRSTSPVYLLGLNPGGSPISQAEERIGRDLEDWQRLPENRPAYADESWQSKPPGTCGLQPRVLHLMSKLGLDPRLTPASNVVFVRSSTEAQLAGEKLSLLAQCWPIHRTVIQRLQVRTIICLGSTAGS